MIGRAIRSLLSPVVRPFRRLFDERRWLLLLPSDLRWLTAAIPRRRRPSILPVMNGWLRSGTFIPRLKRRGIVTIKSLHGPLLTLEFPADVDYQSVAVLGSYETGTTELCEQVLRKGDTVFDVGANIGWYTALFGMLVGASGTVHAFEPDPATFRRLGHITTPNHLGAWVHLERRAVGRSSGVIQLFRPQDLPHGHRTTLRDEHRDHEPIDVELTSLDDYVRTKLIDRVDLVKVDVEGAENSVIEGAQHLLSTQRPMWILELNEEAAGSAAREPLARLQAEGYRFLRIPHGWKRAVPVDSLADCRHGDNVFAYTPQLHRGRLPDRTR